MVVASGMATAGLAGWTAGCADTKRGQNCPTAVTRFESQQLNGPVDK